MEAKAYLNSRRSGGETVSELRDIWSSDEESKRATIINLHDSYSFPYDLLTELVQNAVDAIRAHVRNHGDVREHEIRVEIDQSTRTLRVSDTGVGIPNDALHRMIGPHVGTKRGDGNSAGEKGVGMTFTAFSCNEYEVLTTSATGSIHGRMRKGSAWRTQLSDTAPMLEILSEDSSLRPVTETGTTITLGQVEVRSDLPTDPFDLNLPSLGWILRTQTAIGSTRVLFGLDDVHISVHIQILRLDGTDENATVPFGYQSPVEFISDRDIIDMSEFRPLASTMNDQQKRAKLQGKVLTFNGAVERAGRTIRYHVVRIPKRDLWREVAERNQLLAGASAEQDDDALLVRGGIFVATKGMPTSVQLTAPKTGFSGDWPTILILIEDVITFDLGRKSVPPRTQQMLKDICHTLFNRDWMPFRAYVQDDNGGEPQVVTSTVAFREKLLEFEDISRLSDLGLSTIRYRKHPDRQEAAVVAIFHELVGQGTLRRFQMARTGYRQRYDSWGFYEHPTNGEYPLVLEFKYAADSILSDVRDNRKFFAEIDLLVCWDLDESKFAPYQVAVRHLSESSRTFAEAQYVLEWPSSENLGDAGTKPVLALRPLIDSLRHSSGS